MALGTSPPQPEQDLLVGAFAGIELHQNPTITLLNWEDATETVMIDDDIKEKGIAKLLLERGADQTDRKGQTAFSGTCAVGPLRERRASS